MQRSELKRSATEDRLHCVLKLKCNGEPENSELVIVPCGCHFSFWVPPSNYKYAVESNNPSQGRPFARKTFYPLDSEFSESGEFHANTEFLCAGSFEYRVMCYSWETNSVSESYQGFVLVQPMLKLNGCSLPMDALSLQTVLTPCLGPVSGWGDSLRPSSMLHYNMIHFTPIQTPGLSGSCYSIFDHNQLSPLLFPDIPRSSFSNNSDWEAKKWSRLSEVLSDLEHRQNLLSMTDVVLNHVAFNNPLLFDHPEATYNMTTAPHLQAALELHLSLMQLSEDLGSGRAVDDDGVLSAVVRSEKDIQRIVDLFQNKYLQNLKLWEYFVIDVDQILLQFESLRSSFMMIHPCESLTAVKILSESVVDSRPGQRHSMSIPMRTIENLFSKDIPDSRRQLKDVLNQVNCPLYDIYNEVVKSIKEALFGSCRYEWLTQKKGCASVDINNPLVQVYFNQIRKGTERLYVANNGFMWNWNVKDDFAAPGKRIAADTPYLRRQIVIWGDCVKLRYGGKPADSPWLWSYMTEYVSRSSRLFHALRLDNAHGTPIHVTTYMMDVARAANPNIVILAELFTGRAELDREFISSIGINLLIRESMQAPTPFELSRFVHMCGGRPVSSLIGANESIERCQPATVPAIFYDCTHDNETPFQKRRAEDFLPNAALVALSACPIGSTRGYDELVPYTLSVVMERRRYRDSITDGIGRAKSVLNRLHTLLSVHGYDEIHVHHDQVPGGGDLITIQRNHPKLRRSVVTICRTAFGGSKDSGSLPSVYIPGRVIGVFLSSRLEVSKDPFVWNDSTITGLESVLWDGPMTEFCSYEKRDSIGYLHLNEENFLPGSVLSVLVDAHPSLPTPQSLLSSDECFGYLEHTSEFLSSLPNEGDVLTSEDISELKKVLEDPQVDSEALTTLLYHCDNEERDVSGGTRGNYGIPDVSICFSGIAGICIPLEKVIRNNDTGHPICNHLRTGLWLLDYTLDRIRDVPSLSGVHYWLFKHFELIRQLPNTLVPLYFSHVIMTCYRLALSAALNRLSSFCSLHPIVKFLALTSYQFVSIMPSAPLIEGDARYSLSMAAGFDHFSTGYMRNWGRDTFIALRGLLLTTGRFSDARSILLGYAGVVRHGSIPNLMDKGTHARFNARDATWWFLQSLQDYVKMSDDYEILGVEVTRLYPCDEPENCENTIDMPLRDIIQEIMQKQAEGLDFVEWHAGPSLDISLFPLSVFFSGQCPRLPHDRMQTAGFRVHTHLDRETGLIYGGNSQNCGTWMDKMGESSRTGTWGVPATPRDGAAIEIIGLLKSTVRWLSELNKLGQYTWAGVRLDGLDYTFSDWSNRLTYSFESQFYIPLSAKDDSKHSIDRARIRDRGYYKDTVGSSRGYADYQLRPNQLVAMVVAPELFESDHVQTALQTIERLLLPSKDQLGIKTLSVLDQEYRGSYDNDNDGGDKSVAKGWNYHQGPEWLWPFGYYLRARFERDQFFYGLLHNHRLYLEDDHYASLPELTNENGSFCRFSCRSQAWSVGCILDAVHDYEQKRQNERA